MDRERSIQEFQSEDYFKIDAFFVSADGKNKQQIKAVLNHKFKTAKESRQFLELCSDSNYVVSQVAVKPTKRNPAPPFTTSTLQQEASRKLGFGRTQP